MPALPSPLPAEPPANTYFQPPPTVTVKSKADDATSVDRFVLFGGGVAFGFACGIDAAIIAVAWTSDHATATMTACGIALSVLLLASVIVHRHIMRRPWW